MASEDYIEYRHLDEKDMETVCQILKSDFTSNEPASMQLNLRGNCPQLMSYRKHKLQQALKQHASIGAYDKRSGELAGFIVACFPLEMTEVYKGTVDCDAAPLNFRQMFALLSYCLEGVAEEIGDVKHMDITYLTCRPVYSGCGIATKLFEKIVDLAQSKSCKKIFVVAFNHYVQRIAENNGFYYHKEVLYAKYVDPITNAKIFADTPKPHLKAAVLMKTL